MAKHVGGFLLGYLTDLGVDSEFISTFLQDIVNPSLVHEASLCSWDSETCTLKTPDEFEEDTANDQLVSQSWFKDIVEQYEAHQQTEQKKSKAYAAAEALFDLDATHSILTMHKKNDNLVNADETEERSIIDSKQSLTENTGLSRQRNQDEESVLDENKDSHYEDGVNVDRPGKKVERDSPHSMYWSGHTPTSVGVRFLAKMEI
jgi:hypothetical protein